MQLSLERAQCELSCLRVCVCTVFMYAYILYTYCNGRPPLPIALCATIHPVSHVNPSVTSNSLSSFQLPLDLLIEESQVGRGFIFLVKT